MDELAPGLWRWTSIHSDAEESPQPGSPADWLPEVGSVAYVADDTLVLIDPLVPDEVWPPLDERVLTSHGEPVLSHGREALRDALA